MMNRLFTALVALVVAVASVEGFAAPNTFGGLLDDYKVYQKTTPNHPFPPRGNINKEAPSVRSPDKHKMFGSDPYPEHPFAAAKAEAAAATPVEEAAATPVEEETPQEEAPVAAATVAADSPASPAAKYVPASV